MPFLEGWSYRRAHNVIGSTIAAQSNYQMKFIVRRESGSSSGSTIFIDPDKCEEDFVDIRFTDDLDSLLDYWIITSNTLVAEIWVELNTIAVGPDTQSIYCYYGNPDASSVSSGLETFIRWDDFDLGYTAGDSLKPERGWTIDAPVVDVQEDPADSSNLVMRIWDEALNPGVRNTFPIQVGIALHYRTRRTGGTRYSPYSFDNQGDYAMTCRWSATVIEYFSGSYLPFTPVLQCANNIWYEFEVRLVPTQDIAQIIRGGTTYVGGWRGTPNNIAEIWFGRADGATGYIDRFFVRKFISPEPTHGSWGIEESCVTQNLNEVLNLDLLLSNSPRKTLTETLSSSLFLLRKVTKEIREPLSLKGKVSRFFKMLRREEMKLTTELSQVSRKIVRIFEYLSFQENIIRSFSKVLLQTFSLQGSFSFSIIPRIRKTVRLFAQTLTSGEVGYKALVSLKKKGRYILKLGRENK